MTITAIICVVIFVALFYWSSDLIDDFVSFVMVLGISVVCALIPAFIYYAIQEQRQWEQFKVEHNCKIVGKISGSTAIGPTVNSNGTVGTTVVTTPGKDGWLCDDGITYWR